MAIRTVPALSVRELPVGGNPRRNEVPPSLRGLRALTILIHGFNNSQKVAAKSYRQFLSRSRLHHAGVAGQVCAFYWPGDHGMLRYYQEIPRARDCASILREYLVEIAGEGQLEVSLICHSLGNRLALELIAECRETPRLQFARVAMMAAAVPLHFVEPNGPFEAAAAAVSRREVLYSRSDEALGVAFLGGQLLAGEPSIGAIGKTGGPAGVWSLTTDMTPYGHSDYWPEPESALAVQVMFGMATSRYLPRRSRLERLLAPLSRLPRREMPSRILFASLDELE